MSNHDLHWNRLSHWMQEGRGLNQSEKDPLYPSNRVMSPVKIDDEAIFQQVSKDRPSHLQESIVLTIW